MPSPETVQSEMKLIMEKPDYNIQSLDAAFCVLQCFIQSMGSPLRFTEICKKTGFSKNRVFRILTSLCDWGYLEKDHRTNEYSLGPTLLIFGDIYQGKKKTLREAALTYLQTLAEKSGDMAVLSVPFGDIHMVIIEAVQGSFTLQGRAGTGETFSLHGGAVSRFFLAALDEDEREKVLNRIEYQRFTEKTITNKYDLAREIEIAQQNGYAIAEEDLEPGIVAIGAPVCDVTRNIVAGLALVIPTVRYTETHKREMIPLIVEEARKLSIQLGYFDENGRNPCA